MRFAVCSVFVLGLSGLSACENTPIGMGSIDRPAVTAPAETGADAAAPSGGGPVNESKADATAEPNADAASSSPVAVDAEASAEVSVAKPDVPDAGSDLAAPATEANDGAASDANGASDAVAAERPPLLSCAALAVAGKATSLKSFHWMYEVGPGGPGSYGRPYDTVTLTQPCELTYEKTILPKQPPPAPWSTKRTVTLAAADCAEARGWATNMRFLEVLLTGDMCPYGEGNPDDEFEVTLSDGTLDQRKTYLCPEPTLDAVRACTSALVQRSFP